MRRRHTSLLATLLSRLTGNRAPTPPDKPMGRFQAIAIFRGATACEIARRFSEHRFLAKDAPSLPLQGCTMPQSCQCCYLKFKDRRAGPPRRVLDFAAARAIVRNERRSSRGRRQSD